MFQNPMNRREFAGLTAGLATQRNRARRDRAGRRRDRLVGPRPSADLDRQEAPRPAGLHVHHLPAAGEDLLEVLGPGQHGGGRRRTKPARIGKELAALGAGAGFPLEILPLATVTSARAGPAGPRARLRRGADLPGHRLGGRAPGVLSAEAGQGRDLFVRHQLRAGLLLVRGPEHALSSRRARHEEIAQNTARNHGGVTVHDVVVDDYARGGAGGCGRWTG